MAHETSKVTGFAIDNSTGALTDISGSVNSVTAQRGFEELDDTGLGDSIHSRVPGLGMASTYDVNGWVNSTTRTIFAPLVHKDTGAPTKTISIKEATGVYYKGEAVVSNVTMGKSVGSLNTWSCTVTAVAGLTQTSVLGT
jgi:hypothetical protein